MERGAATRHDGVPMERDSSRTRIAAWLAIAAALGTGCVVALGTREVAGLAWAGVLQVASAGAAIAVIRRRGTQWPARPGIRAALLLWGAGVAVVTVTRATGAGTDARWLERGWPVAMLIPLALAARAEFRAHFDPPQRMAVGLDAALMAAASAAAALTFVVPADATARASFAALAGLATASAALAIFGALALWSRGRAHTWLAFGWLPASVAVAVFGLDRALGRSHTATLSRLLLFAAPLALAATLALVEHGDSAERRASSRLSRPLLSSAPIVAAVAASVVVAVHRSVALDGWTTPILAVLALGVAGRVLAERETVAAAQAAGRVALDRRDAALDEAERALERLRQANETLQHSEEHLRMVFGTAVDGLVELDETGTIRRTNSAFASMVRLDPLAIEGQKWSALASAIDGADSEFGSLPHGGSATIRRTDGSVIHLESRTSTLPTDPPRRLLLIRDVTSAKVADQTIRSLFQFLQDRDEDRTRLLRRTNAAIEQERNRIARDLHDGPVQGVSAVSLSLEAALLMIKGGDLERGLELLSRLRQDIATEADGLRRLMAGLRPPVLEERGLLPALREMLARFGTEQGISTDFSGSLDQPLAGDLETLAYRVAQEALANIARHAGAQHVGLFLDADQGQLRIEIEDDGKGFDVNRARDYLHAGRVGLASMRERVELASGTFAVRSTPGRGTAVMATIPLDSLIVLETDDDRVTER